jgi:predicted nucleic acid-binding protein
MQSSPEPGGGVVLFDANVLSRLARIGRSDIVSTTFPGRCYVAPAVYREIEAGVAVGVSRLDQIMALVEHKELQVLDIQPEDREYGASLPRKLGLGETEGIALCRRLGMVFITHDRKAANFCHRAGVKCLHFRVLVETLEKRGLLTSEQARQALE